jgi:hypothetical protein
MRHLILLSLVAALAACGQPRQETPTEADAPAPTPAVVACNQVAPDAGKMVSVQDPLAAAAAVADLRGGRIAPGTYDLVSATRVGQPTGWPGQNAVALQVDEAQSGEVTFNWASTRADDRWTATFAEAPAPSLTFTCGRMGTVGADFAVAGTNLQLRLPDGASGSLDLTFAPRS